MKLKILIVGAGIAGLALSLALQRRGCFAHIIERNTEWRDIGTGLYLPGNALRALRALQIDRHVEIDGAPIRTQRFCDRRGRLLTEVDVASVWDKVGPCVAVHRADLHAALREAQEATLVRMGMTVTRIEQDSNLAVVHFSDDTHEAYDLVVGADGIGSAVRRLEFGTAGVRALKQWSWRFVMPCPPTITTWSVLMNRASACLMMPIGRGEAYCYVDLIGRESTSRVTSSLQEELADFGPQIMTIREALDIGIAVHAAEIEEVVLDRWSRGRVLLIGDAAHAMSPNMAQGAALALEDGILLAECLSEMPSIETAIAAYEARRVPRINRVLNMTHRRDRIRHLHPVVRNELLRAFGERVYRSHYRHLLTKP